MAKALLGAHVSLDDHALLEDGELVTAHWLAEAVDTRYVDRHTE